MTFIPDKWTLPRKCVEVLSSFPFYFSELSIQLVTKPASTDPSSLPLRGTPKLKDTWFCTTISLKQQYLIINKQPNP